MLPLLASGCSVETSALLPTVDAGSRTDAPGCVPVVEACNGADDDCDGRVDEGFELLDDPANCGECGNACPADPDHGAPTCVGGSCGVACDDGFANCDGLVPNGCESSLSSPGSCGGCGVVCEGATPLCQIATPGEASCVSSCSMGLELCGTSCIDTSMDALNCGACGTICPARDHASSTCDGGSCSFRCDGGYANCDMIVETGCEASLDAPASCGACGTSCTRAHAIGSCISRACDFVCEGGWGNCNDSMADGCEQGLSTLAHCGGCNAACVLANATASCMAGACSINSCNTSFDDCDGMDANGCEADLRATATCGSCTTACSPGQTCDMGACTGLCPSGSTCTSGCATGGGACECTTGSCFLGCAADCETRCSGGSTTCQVDGNGSSTVDSRCQSGATCRVNARSTASAAVRCENSGTECTVDCAGSSSCNVICVSGAQCELFCAGATSCSFTMCEGGSTSCGSGRRVCNRPC